MLVTSVALPMGNPALPWNSSLLPKVSARSLEQGRIAGNTAAAAEAFVGSFNSHK